MIIKISLRGSNEAKRKTSRPKARDKRCVDGRGYRKSRKKDIIASKSEFRSCLGPLEQSVSSKEGIFLHKLEKWPNDYGQDEKLDLGEGDSKCLKLSPRRRGFEKDLLCEECCFTRH